MTQLSDYTPKKIGNFNIPKSVIECKIDTLAILELMLRKNIASWEEIDEIPTELAQEELRFKLEKMIKVPYEVLEHVAGVRPATFDRRPLLGRHPVYSNLAIFNSCSVHGISSWVLL